MAIEARKLPGTMIAALVKAHNDRMIAKVASEFHASVTQLTTGDESDPAAITVANAVVASADATDLATSLTLVNEIRNRVNKHFSDSAAHDAAVSAVVAVAEASTLAEAQTLANALKTAWGDHLDETNVHYTDDATNTIAAADATDQTSLNTLLNEMKDDYNAHIVSAPANNVMVDVVDP